MVEFGLTKGSYPAKVTGTETEFKVGTSFVKKERMSPSLKAKLTPFVDGYDSHYLYEALLVNLVPDTRYYYRCGKDGVNE